MALAPAVTVNLPGYPFSNLPAVDTFAALRAISSAELTDGANITVNGSSAVGDGGGGMFLWGASSLATDDGTSIIKPTDTSIGVAGRWLRNFITPSTSDLASTATNKGAGLVGLSHNATYPAASVGDRLRREIYITDHPFNAACDFSTIDTAAAQAALDYAGDNGGGTVVIPDATQFNDTLTITKPNVKVKCLNDKAIIGAVGNYGDVFHCYPATGPNLQGIRFEGVYVYALTDTTSGSIIHLEDCNGFRIDRCKLAAHYGGIHLDGAVHGYIDTDTQSDANFTSFRSGSFLFKASRSSAGTIPAEVHVAKADWRGQNGNNYLNYAVLIECSDGIWFDTPHFGFAKVGFAMLPGADTDPIISIIVKGGYLDTCSTNLLQAIRPSSSYSADFGLHELDFATQYNSGEDGWLWDCESTGNNFWSTIQLGKMLNLGGHGVNLTRCQKLAIQNGWAISAPSYVSSGKSGINMGADADQVRIGKGNVDKGSAPNTPAAAISIANGADNFDIDKVHYLNTTAGISDSSTTSNKSIVSAVNW